MDALMKKAQTEVRSELALDGSVADALLASALRLDEGHEPFPWQARLLRRLRDGDLPRSLDIPTGLGKTSTIAIWLLARACGADVPRRIVYVVDRRAVVDQATRVAEELREWVGEQPGVAAALGLQAKNLPVSTLRGKFVDNREWLENPAAPAIIVGTVDMIGSRLLFEGYRATRKMRPYLAGLLGHDSLFVLDEAHLVPPFERLLERITLEGDDLGPGADAHMRPPAPRLLSLSATGRSRGGKPFELDEDDLDHPVVRQRLEASKRLEIESVGAEADIAVVAAERAWTLAGEGTHPVRCIVYLSRRSDAQKAMAHLSSLAGIENLKKGQARRAEVDLLVGERRVLERAQAAERLGELGFLAGSPVERQHPVFLFSTSAGEVGIDLDADCMVSDLVPWERMVQRFGRVNRRGTGNAKILVLDAAVDATEDPAKGAWHQGVHSLLQRLPPHGTDAGSGSLGVDVSPGALRSLQQAARSDRALSELIGQASTSEPLYPPLDRATLDAWSMTSVHDHAGRPSVAPWLRGWVEDRPQTSVVWRKYLPPKDGPRTETSSRQFFEAAPAHTSEVLEAETSRVSEWLIKRAKKLLAAAEKLKSTDSSALSAKDDVAIASSDEEFYRWTVKELAEMKKDLLERRLHGLDLFVDARLGGVVLGLLDPGCDDPPCTLDGEAWGDIEVPFRVRETKEAKAIESPEWRERARFVLERDADGTEIRWLVVERRPKDATTEDDRSGGPPQTLAEHQAWTAKQAANLAAKLLPTALRPLLILAARLHDEGKRAPRWQAAFHAAAGGQVLAKTRGPVNVRLLDGYRHELGSLPYAEKDPEVAGLSDEDRDLVLHLIASHHGHARPSIPTSGCDDAPPSALEARARQIALRFLRLQRRWGPWGLAWWESLLRASDQNASRENDARDPAQQKELA